MHRERCEDLLDQWIEGDLSEVGVHELNDILRLDSALVRDACDRLAEHRLLGLLHRPFDVDAFTDSIISAAEAADQVAINATVDAIDSGTSSGQPITNENLRHDRRSGLKKAAASQFRLPIGLVAIAVSIFCIMLGIDVVRRDFRYLSANTINAQQIVATLVLEEDCQWQGEQLIEGQRLSQGDLLLNSGVAVVRFDGGAEVIARGECSLELLSAGSVSLKFGDIIVRASEVAMGFRVSTPSSEMIDLGTEFSVNVDGEGETKLNVLEGEVSIRPRALESQQTHLLSEGSSVVVHDGKASPIAASHDNLRFDAVIRNARLRGKANLRYAYDGFFYDEGDVPLVESTKGNGWIGPWRKRTINEGYRSDQDTTDALQIVHGKMNNTWGVRGGDLGVCEMPPGITVRLRQMTRTVDLGEDGVYYFTMMVREPDHSELTEKSRPHEGMRFTLRSSQDYYGEVLSFGINHSAKPRITTGMGIGFAARTKSPSNQTTLWVGKIVSRKVGEDEVMLRIFGEDESISGDVISWAEPAQWDVVTRNLDLSGEFDLFVMTSQGNLTRFVDEIRIGPTWRSVAPLR